MEYVKLEDAVKHANSPNCTAYEYPMQNQELNLGVVEVSGRYPTEGCVINHKCSEIVYILKGSGKLETATQSAHLSAGDVAYIPRGEKYFWEGEFTLVIPATPAWHPEQHETVLAYSSP